MANEKINVKCPKCSQALVIQKPAKPGLYQLTCSKCSQKFNLQLRGVPIKVDEKKPESRKKVKVLGEPKPAANGKYRIEEPALLNHPYGCVCPECGKAVVFMPRQAGAQAVKCDKCSTMIIFKAVESLGQEGSPSAQKAAPKKEEKKGKEEAAKEEVTQRVRQKDNKSMGMLTWGNIFMRKKHILCEGKIIIGREDADYPSDIEFTDKKMSRRSVEIDVARKENGFFFKLTVLKATNPVYVNNSELAEGESVYLKYGDCIQVGKTLINFQARK